MIYTGDYVDRGDKKYIIYRDYNEGHPKNYTLCIIKVDKNNMITLTKNTKYQTRIVFEKGVSHYSPYCTEFGLLTMSSFTHNIENNLSANGGNLNIKYSLSLNSNFISLTEISVDVKKK